MFQKVLIANRGEIAVRIERTCREMGIPTLALYEQDDLCSLHVRLADECVQLPSPAGFLNQEAILGIAIDKGVGAIHPGYGFLAEIPEFILACQQAGLTFIGPQMKTVISSHCKVEALEQVRAAGYPAVEYAPVIFQTIQDGGLLPIEEALQVANQLGYPVVIKSCNGGRGRLERLVRSPSELEGALRRSLSEVRSVYTSPHVYLEKAILPCYRVGVTVLADQYNQRVVVGDHQSLKGRESHRLLIESPAPCLSEVQRGHLWQLALDLAELFQFQNMGTLEFLIDSFGQAYFCEIKARIPLEHPLYELCSGFDLVREQIRLAAGEHLSSQLSRQPRGRVMLACIYGRLPGESNASDGLQLRKVRLPEGPNVRIDSFIYPGCTVSSHYDPLLAKLAVWGETRGECLGRLQRALQEVSLAGIETNLPELQQLTESLNYTQGDYVSGMQARESQPEDHHLRDLAVAAAVLYAQANRELKPVFERANLSLWRKKDRVPPQWLYSGIDHVYCVGKN